MRVILWMAAAAVLSLATPAVAQEWDEFLFPEDGFSVNFPGRPQVETTTWVTQYHYTLPARVYRASKGNERFVATAVDYRPLEKMGPERSKQCPAEAETCIGTQDGRQGGVLGLGYWKMDVRGAMTYAALKFIQRPGVKVSDYNLEFQQVVEGYMMHLVNADQSRTNVYITMHDNRLYVFEATVPKGYPEPALFTGSVGILNAEGKPIRYTDYYTNSVHGLRQYEPPPVRVQGGAPAAAAPAAPAR